MPNPKITISIDQSCVDVFNRIAAALENLCAAVEKPGYDTPSVAEPEKPAEPTPVVEAPVAPVTPVHVAPIPAPGMNGFDFTASADQAQPVQNVAMPTAAPVAPAAPAAAAQMPTATAPAQMPTATAPALTMEMLGMAGSQLMGMGVNAQALLGEFGITRLSDLPPERYPEMAARMRQLGAKI